MTPTNQPHGAHRGHGDPREQIQNPDVGHEHGDVNVRALLTFAAGMAIVTAIAAVAMWAVFNLLEHQAAQNDPPVTPLAAPTGNIPRETTYRNASPGQLQQFPEPRLQTNEPFVLEEFREAQRQALEGYGWVDQKAGVARMPIEEAKKLILQRGLPVRQGGAADPHLGTRAAAMGEASGGRTIRKPAAATPAASPTQDPAQEKKEPAAPQPPKGHGQ